MKIEKAKNSDAKDITELTIRSKSRWNYGKEQIEEWRDELTIAAEYIDENQVYKLVKNNILIGFYAYQAQNGTDIKLNFLFVEPKFMGQGYGQILMVDFLQRIEKSGFKRITLDADPNAEEFYLRLGFRVIGQLKSSIKDRYLPIMEKEIKSINNTP